MLGWDRYHDLARASRFLTLAGFESQAVPGIGPRPRGGVPPLTGLGDFVGGLPSTPLRCVLGNHCFTLATRRAQNQR